VEQNKESLFFEVVNEILVPRKIFPFSLKRYAAHSATEFPDPSFAKVM